MVTSLNPFKYLYIYTFSIFPKLFLYTDSYFYSNLQFNAGHRASTKPVSNAEI